MLVSNISEDKATGIYSSPIDRASWQLLPAVSDTAVVPQCKWSLIVAVFIKAPLPPHTNTIKNFENYLVVDSLLLNHYVVVNYIL